MTAASSVGKPFGVAALHVLVQFVTGIAVQARIVEQNTYGGIVSDQGHATNSAGYGWLILLSQAVAVLEAVNQVFDGIRSLACGRAGWILIRAKHGLRRISRDLEA